MKVAPIAQQFRELPHIFESRIVHTGQHYDAAMSEVFFEQLGIPEPDLNLNVGSASHAQQTAAVMAAFEPVLLDFRPHVVIVVGDVNSTIACALVAAKLEIAVAHVEAGLRSFDRHMPEEINRVLTDHISDLLFTTERSGNENLQAEGIAADSIHFVGNVMIDTLLKHRDRARDLDVARRHSLERGRYVVLTLHRPSNVDDAATFERLMRALDGVSRDLPVVFPIHPRTRAAIVASTLGQQMIASGRMRLLDPLGYLEFLGLTEASYAVLTDSGGIQEETTVLGVPCLTLRENTERPVTVSHGTNRIVGTDTERILAAWQELRSTPRTPSVPEFWDGSAAARIVAVLQSRFAAAANS
jgi:UDP-N-acetylglucosamine 2-epimerase (non-hydrolysing)